MKKITSLFLTAALLFFCNWAEAQTTNQKRPNAKASFFSEIKTKSGKRDKPSSHSKKETQKKLATYTYIEQDDETGNITDTSEKYVITWGDNGLPTQVILSGSSDDIIEGQMVDYRVIYTDFVKVNSKNESEGDFSWISDDIDFDSKSGIAQVRISNNWVNYIKLEKVISSEGLVQEFKESDWKITRWENTYRELYTYDANNNITEYLSQEWDNGQWVNSYKYTVYFDSDSRNTGSIEERWEGNEWVTSYGNKTILTKNGSNQIISAERQNINDEGNWVSTVKQSYVLNSSGEITEVLEQQFINGEWLNMTQFKNIVWKSFDALNSFSYPLLIGGQNFQSMDAFSYNVSDSSWNESTRYRNIFSGNNMTNSVTMYNYGTGWDTSTNIISTYYPNGDLKEYKSLYKENGVWVVQYGYGNNNTYDNDGDLIKNIGLNWDSDSKEFVESYIELYTYTMVTVGIAKNGTTKASVNVYPNPVTTGNITISLANATTPANVSVYDNTGRILMQTSNNELKANITLDVNALPKGLYIVNVNQAGNISKAQFIIQ